MSKKIAIILCLCLISTPFFITFANSGPTYFDPDNVYSMYTSGKTNIEVTKEDLLFDFTQQTENSGSLSAKVRAEYTLKNPTQVTESVHLIFPMENAISALAENTTLTLDGELLDYTILFTSATNQDLEDKSFDDILKLYTYDDAKVKSLKTLPVTHYHLDLNTLRQTYSMTDVTNIMFYGEKTPTQLLFIENVGYIKITDDNDFEFSVDTKWSLKDKSTLDFYTTDALNSIHYKLILSDDSAIDFESGPPIEEDKTNVETLANLFTTWTDTDSFPVTNMDLFYQYFYHTHEFINSLSELDAFISTHKIIFLSYDVTLPANSESIMTVNYQNVNSGFDRRTYKNPAFTYNYYLSPASHWAGFKDLTITILPPDSNPYLVDSNLEFEKIQGGYQARYDAIPSNVLEFALHQEEIPKEKSFFDTYFMMTLVYLLIISAPFILLIVIILILIMHYKRKHNRNENKCMNENEEQL